MFKTWVTKTLGVQYPIIQGAMLWISGAELASAVSNAGGLGIIGAGSFLTAEEFQGEIKKMKTMTDKPFGVNITLMPTKRPVNWEEYFCAAIDEGVKIIETSGRNPEPYMALLKQSGATILHRVARTKDAQKAERLGVDAVSVIGFEAGGHPGFEDVTSLIRVPRTVDSVNIPVIAAGGFGDARGLVAALALGAEGILMGTRFMASQESPLHPKIKEFFRQTKETDTMIIDRSFNNESRVIKTDFSSKVLEMEGNGATLDELYPLIRGSRIKKSYASGDINDAILYCGQVIGLLDETPSVKDIIDSIVEGAELVYRRLNSMRA